MNKLHPIKMPSAKEQVASELRKAILSKNMKEDEILSLESIATQLNVSITPVREAFQILARDGLIKLRQNKGAVVLGINETYIREHYQLRAILESAAAGLACREEVDTSGISSSYENTCEMIEAGDYSDYAFANREFHNEIWLAAGNSKMANMISELWNGLSLGNMVSESDYAKISTIEHGRIVKAIEEKDEEKARKEMYDHIMRSRDDMLTYYQ